MTTGERIRALLLRAQELREELRHTEKMLSECESSCTHENTRERVLVILPNDPESIVCAVIECNDCGVRKFKPSKKKHKKKGV